MHRHHPDIVIRLIALLKLAKAGVLITVGVGALSLLHSPDGALAEWIDALVFDPHGKYLHALVLKISGLDAHQLELIATGSLMYASVFVIEGIGLMMRRIWAEIMTVLITASFVPLELYELVDNRSVAKAVVIVVNVLVVLYLLRRLHRQQQWPFHRRATGPVA